MDKVSKEYIIYAENKDIYDRALELKYDDIKLLNSYDELKEEKRYIVILLYRNEDEEDFDDDKFAEEHNQIREAYSKHITFFNIWEFEYSTFEEALDKMITQDRIENFLIYSGLIHQIYTKDTCGNCHAELLEGSKYCYKCGTKRGEGKFDPFFTRIFLAYGPPVIQKATCLNCGYKFETGCLGGNKVIKHCPECRSTNLSIKEEVKDFYLD